MSKKGKFVPINTLGDLTDLVNHNCRVIDKRLNKLCRKNRGLTAIAMAAIGCAIWSEIERCRQEEQIYQLSIRVKKLERTEEV